MQNLLNAISVKNLITMLSERSPHVVCVNQIILLQKTLITTLWLDWPIHILSKSSKWHFSLAAKATMLREPIRLQDQITWLQLEQAFCPEVKLLCMIYTRLRFLNWLEFIFLIEDGVWWLDWACSTDSKQTKKTLSPSKL